MVYWSDFVFSPPGFYGKDIAIDVLSAVVVLLIGLFVFRNFLLDKENKKHLFMSAAFMLLGLSFIVKVLTNVMTHYEGLTGKEWVISIMGAQLTQTYSVLTAIGFLLYATLTLFGFYLLYALSSKDRLSMNYVIIAYFILVTTYFTRFNYFLIYLTAFVFLMSLTRRYLVSYLETKYRNTLMLTISFALISISQLAFIFTISNHALYVAAEVIQLVGYLFLLYTFVMVLRNARKKK
ncbi:MAG: hypothetical protein V1866_04685 [archaeon]